MAKPKDQRSYLYCIIAEIRPRQFQITGVAGEGDKVRTVHFKDLAAVVGRPPSELHALTREAAIAHEKAIEEVMRRYTVLPVSFGVVARSQAELKTRLLREKYSELKEALGRLEGKVELDLKAFWLDMDKIFQEIAQELQVASSSSASYSQRIAIGERVAQMVVQKKKQEAEVVIAQLRGLAEETVEKEIPSDRLVCDCAFLVQKKREAVFDQAVAQAAAAQEGRMKFKYVLSPPYNFVNLHLNLA